MLVYANTFNLSGSQASECSFKALGAWFKEKLGYGLHPEQLKMSGSHEGKDKKGTLSRLKIHAADGHNFKLYSWILTHQCPENSGRQWVIEVGLKEEETGNCLFSCVVRTDERSTLVASPVTASRPRLITYLTSNISRIGDASFGSDVCGTSMKTVGDDTDSYRALLIDIEHEARKRPIVIVSPERSGHYLLDPDRLQGDLVGLAQVIKVQPEYNSYEMSETLTERLSAWYGAINIIYPIYNSSYCYNKLLRSTDLEQFVTPIDRISHILALITNRTNVVALREHIRPEGVSQLSLHNKLEAILTRTDDMSSDELKENFQTVAAELEKQKEWVKALEDGNVELEEEKAKLSSSIEELEEDLKKKNYDNSNLKQALSASGKSNNNASANEKLFACAASNDSPTPSQCLDIVSEGYSDVCIILDSAYNSAHKMKTFKHGRRLLDMFKRLLTEYREKLKNEGDATARKVFTDNEYAANESEGVANNTTLRRLRTFEHEEKQVTMFQHLRIGTDNNPTTTIRVYFHWDATQEKIVIGYCGEHLPIVSQ